MAWVDTHCHLQLDGRPPAELLARAPEVEWVVVPGVDAASSKDAIGLAERFPRKVLATAGLHPHDATRWPEEASVITELASEVAAIGETGLDFYRDLSPRHDQEQSFREQLALALDLGKPVVVHCRDAFSAVHRIVEETGAGPLAVLHCWTGGPKWTRRFLDLGVTFSIDDFGTGYSSLTYLKKLPVTGMKIDKSFVQHMEQDRDNAIIVRSMIDLGHNLGLKVIAEGVETHASKEMLRQFRCDLGQGYYFSRPVSANEATKVLTASTCVPVQTLLPTAPLRRAK